MRHLIRDEYSRVFQKADLILSPIAPDVAPKIGSFQDPLEMYKSDMFTISVNLAGLPAISIPVDRDKNGNALLGFSLNLGNLFSRKQESLMVQ